MSPSRVTLPCCAQMNMEFHNTKMESVAAKLDGENLPTDYWKRHEVTASPAPKNCLVSDRPTPLVPPVTTTE